LIVAVRFETNLIIETITIDDSAEANGGDRNAIKEVSVTTIESETTVVVESVVGSPSRGIAIEARVVISGLAELVKVAVRASSDNSTTVSNEVSGDTTTRSVDAATLDVFSDFTAVRDVNVILIDSIKFNVIKDQCAAGSRDIVSCDVTVDIDLYLDNNEIKGRSTERAESRDREVELVEGTATRR